MRPEAGTGPVLSRVRWVSGSMRHGAWRAARQSSRWRPHPASRWSAGTRATIRWRPRRPFAPGRAGSWSPSEDRPAPTEASGRSRLSSGWRFSHRRERAPRRGSGRLDHLRPGRRSLRTAERCHARAGGQLKDRLGSLKRLYEQSYAVGLSQVPGSGAAGGLAGALAALGGQIVGGFDLVSAESGLPDAIAGADLVITDEGRLDHTSLQRKVVGGVLALASAASVPCAIAGQVRGRGPARVVSLVDTYGYKCSWEETLACTDDAARRVISLAVRCLLLQTCCLSRCLT
jgi:Glycerate kinase family